MRPELVKPAPKPGSSLVSSLPAGYLTAGDTPARWTHRDDPLANAPSPEPDQAGSGLGIVNGRTAVRPPLRTSDRTTSWSTAWASPWRTTQWTADAAGRLHRRGG